MRCPECSADTRLCQCAEAERDARDAKTPKETKMKTTMQITNAYNRAAHVAHVAVSGEQINNFAATDAQLRSERGNAQCAAGFAAQALTKLENGDLDGFYSCIALSAAFAKDARDERHARAGK